MPVSVWPATMMHTRPPLNEKLFHVHRPTGLIGVSETFFFTFRPVHSSLYKNKIRKKKDSRPTDCPFFGPPAGQETMIHLRVALDLSSLKMKYV